MFWRNKYYLLLIRYQGVYFNTHIKGSISDWLIKNKEQKFVVLQSWEISKEEYRRSK